MKRKPEVTDADHQRCMGTSVTFGRRRAFSTEPHEAGRIVWGKCWSCNHSLGCSTCTGTNALEILCEPCGAWGTKQAFLHHGPVVQNASRPGRKPAAFLSYPAEWRREYDAPAQTGKFTEQTVMALAEEKAIPRDPRMESEREWD